MKDEPLKIRLEGDLIVDAATLLELLVRPAVPPEAVNEGRRWMSDVEVATYTRISVNTIRSWRRDGGAKVLPYRHLGRLIRYDRDEVDAAIDAGLVEVDR